MRRFPLRSTPPTSARTEPARRCERAGAVPLLAAVVLLAALGAAAAGRAGAAAIQRARADAVADLTALAAVDGGHPAAHQVARANEAHVVSLDAASDRTWSVHVFVGGVGASASAAPIGEPMPMSPALDPLDSRIGP